MGEMQEGCEKIRTSSGFGEKRRFLPLLGIVALMSGGLLGGCRIGGATAASGEDVPEYVLTYAENQAEDYPTTQGALRFAELVEERTEGRILIDVQWGGKLGDEKSVIDQLQFGGIDFTRASISPLASYVPLLNVLQMPFLYRDDEHMWSVLHSEIGDTCMAAFEGSNLVPLSWYDAGARNFYNSRYPIRTLEDMKGLKIRVQESDMMIGMVRLLGADGVAIPYGDVYSSLETGVIDGAENNWPSYESTGHAKVAGYYTVDEHTRVPELQLCSQITWEKLSPEDRQIIRECAAESAEYERELWQEREKLSRERLEAEGCESYYLPQEERDRFREAVAPLYLEYCGEHMDMVDRITAMGRVQ